MQITVNAVAGRFDEQTRAYAEFRMFAALARFGPDIDQAVVTLSPHADHASTVACAVSVTFPGGARLHVNARGSHAYDAINRAIGQLKGKV